MSFELKKEFTCSCGRIHKADVDKVIIESGAVSCLPRLVKDYHGSKVFLIADVNTYKAAGRQAALLLEEAGIPYTEFIFRETSLEPDEHAVGSVFMKYDNSCDLIIAVGSGVINDISKIVSHATGHPYFIVATAPSMDGYASPSSAMIYRGVKVSLNYRCPNVIIGDLDILCQAPKKMLQSGLGDIFAKYTSLCEWRISHLINGEYYCETVAEMVRSAVKKCADHADGLLKRDPEAVKSVMEGLILSGVAMAYAGLSRPASGIEHYFSHIWDMRMLEFGTNASTHGIQCGIGSLYACRLYEQILKLTPNREKALSHVSAFDYSEWCGTLKSFLGSSSEALIALEAKERKYDADKHKARLDRIIENWDTILQIIREEVPSAAWMEALLDKIEAPKSAADIGISPEDVPMTFKVTKDIRDKYILSTLAWDLGILEELHVG